MAVTKELLQMDLYTLLGIEEKAEDKEVKKAYRQKTVSCHPDKNPDNPRAAELFHQLSQALEVLAHAAARAGSGKPRSRQQRGPRNDEKGKKVKLDLDARERQAQAQESEEEEEEEESRSTRTLEQEIEHLREEGSRQPEEQQRLLREQKRQEHDQRLTGKTENTEGQGTPRLKLKWKCKKEGEAEGGYSKDGLLRLVQKEREVLNLVLSSKKAGTAAVEFATVRAAELAVQNEAGLVGSPLKISWLEGQPQDTMGRSHPGLSKGSVLQERHRESLVMMRMRQAAGRQQLIPRMGREDQEGPPT
uniref:J domain-containing protein n=1 Tax=Cebus imitator TaxID=2715852 RepID=A0A2K5PEG9_CEBIM